MGREANQKGEGTGQIVTPLPLPDEFRAVGECWGLHYFVDLSVLGDPLILELPRRGRLSQVGRVPLNNKGEDLEDHRAIHEAHRQEER
jgi:hypothetical protein